MARIKVFENATCVCYMALSNCDFEEFEDVHELINNPDQIFVTVFVYCKWFGCTEPYDGVPITNKGAYHLVNERRIHYCQQQQ